MSATVHTLPTTSLAEQQRLWKLYTETAEDFARRWPDVGIEDMRAVVVAHDRFAAAFTGKR